MYRYYYIFIYMNYKNKYQKYKNKYINLKGGANSCLVYFLPCEITNITKDIHYDLSIKFRDILEKIPNVNKIISNEHRYNQDPIILLKTPTNLLSNYGLQISNLLNDYSDVNKESLISNNGNDKGGNFISSPANDINLFGYIFCFDGISDELEKILASNVTQSLIKLKCSFRFNGQRHIDECMCFMPYGNSYKIWFYYIRNVKKSELLTNILIRSNDQNFLDEIKNKFNGIIKSQNSSQNPSQRLIDAVSNLLSDNPKDPLASLNVIRSRLDFNDLKCLKLLYSGQKIDEDDIKFKLRLEQMDNLNLISNNLFGSDYNTNAARFVLFPIDLELNDDNNYKITNIPIFNRLWIETNDMCVLLLSTGNHIDDEVYNIFNLELPYIKSKLDINKPINHMFINTKVYNDAGNVGGNLHCLIKQKY